MSASANGKRRPPRPRIELVSSAASERRRRRSSPRVEQFLADTAPAPAAASRAQSRWQRAALEEGIAARQVSGSAWGHAPR